MANKKKNVPALAKSIETLKTLNSKLLKEADQQRKVKEKLQIQLASLKNDPAAASSSTSVSNKQLMKNLKTLNSKLVEELEEQHKQTEQLRLQLASFNEDRDILRGIEREIIGLVLFSSISEAAARNTAELDAAEMRLLALNREKDDVQMDLERMMLEQRDLTEKAEQRGTIWKKSGFFLLLPLVLLRL